MKVEMKFDDLVEMIKSAVRMGHIGKSSDEASEAIIETAMKYERIQVANSTTKIVPERKYEA